MARPRPITTTSTVNSSTRTRARWTEKTYSISAGTHILKWLYINDQDDKGDNCGWMDIIQLVAKSITGSPSPPPDPANWDEIKYKSPRDVAPAIPKWSLRQKVDGYPFGQLFFPFSRNSY